MIGKRVLDDPRNHLVRHFVRLVSELQPRYCVFENVRGLTLGTHVRFLDELIEALIAAGYQVTLPYAVLNAAHHGVPQDRKRLFLLAARSDQRLAEYPEPLATRVTVGEAISDLPDAERFADLQGADQVAVQWLSDSSYARTMRCLDHDPQDYGYLREFDRDLLTSSLRTEHTDLSRQRFAETIPGDTEPVSRFRRLPADGLCHTLRAGTDSARGAFTSPRPIHPHHPRVITVREAARLHSYPDWFRFHCTKWHGFRQIGNSVPPRLARAVASAIMRALGNIPVKPVETLHTGSLELLQLDMSAAARYFRVPYDTIAQRQRTTNPAQLDLWGAAHG
jgi:DNA (cytosine-5)-methyltransferase 1